MTAYGIFCVSELLGKKNMTCAPYITFKNSQKRTQHCNAPSNDAKFTSVTSEIRLHGLSPFLFTFLKQV